MKFPAISVLFLTSVSATSEIEDLQNGYNVEPRKKTLTETDSIDAHAAKRARRKTTATHTGRRSLQGSKCTPVDLDADALVERYGMNTTDVEHIFSLESALAGELALGSITDLIPESSDAVRTGAVVADGLSGDTNFPFGPIKPILTVGEINMCEENLGDVYVGVPDGMGSYLVDDDTVRIVVQSESYGQLYYESYPYFVNQDARRLGVGSKGGASFTGSHVQYVDLDRESLSTFMTHSGPASDMIKGFGQVADTYYNLAGDLVGPRAANISHASARPHYSNTDVNGIWAVAGAPSEADWLMQSLCSAHLEEAHQWGPGIGLEDDIYITNEEWITYEPGAEFVGISMHAIDLANRVDYAVGSVTVSGFEKIVELNPQSTDYVVLSISGYNGAYNNGDAEIDARNAEYGPRPDGSDWVNPQNVCPARIYVGMKGKMEDGSDAPADDFLARNGLRYGKVYGFATDMDADGQTDGLFRDNYHKCRKNGSKVDGKFVAIDWQWDGQVKNFRHDGAFDFQIDVPGYEGTMMQWWNSGGLSKSGSKTEHNTPDTRPGITGFIQGSTAGYFGHYYIHDIAEALAGPEDFPAELDSTYYVYQGENPLEGQIALGGEGLLNDDVPKCFNLGDAQKNCDSDYSIKTTFEDIDGLEVIAAEEGLFAIIQEDSGNDLGERMFISTVLEHEDDGAELMYHFMAQSGGKYNTRMANGVGVPETSNIGGGSHEFSGIIDLSGMLAKTGVKKGKGGGKGGRRERGLKKGKGGKSSDEEFVISSGDGEGKRIAEHTVPINEKLIALGLQAHNLADGTVAAFKADRGGQLLVYQPDI